MLFAILFGAIVSTLTQGTINHPDCKARNFEPKACKVSELMEKAGKKQ
jgi:hypothetical protein